MKLNFQSFVNSITFLFILLFTYTAVSKFMSLSTFRFTLGQSPLIGKFKGMLAVLLPVTELVIVILLFFPSTRMTGLYSSLVLMILFTLYIGYMLLFASNLPCSCGGVLQEMTWQQHLWFNLFFAALAWLAIRAKRKLLLQ